ncbi:MAG: hypothetical protein J6Z38_04570 [Lachnospiraceae bacterium]|nr:hypothetical protein [Lachnospiraceae bacterium]
MKRFLAAALLLAALFSSCITIGSPGGTDPGSSAAPVPGSESVPALSLSETEPGKTGYPHVSSEGIADPLMKRAAERIDPAVNAALDALSSFDYPWKAAVLDADAQDAARDYDRLGPAAQEVYRELSDAVTHFRPYEIAEKDIAADNPFGVIVDAVYAIYHDDPVTKAYWMDGGDYLSHRPRYFLPNDWQHPTEDAGAVEEAVRFYEAVFRRILDCLPEGLDNERKCVYFAAAVCAACTYDKTKATRDGPFFAYDALVKGTAVCSGYTEAFELLCHAAGVNCESVTGKTVGSDEQHIWNRVATDRGDRYIDVTWTDSAIEESGSVFTSAYFMLDEEMMLNSGYIPDP